MRTRSGGIGHLAVVVALVLASAGCGDGGDEEGDTQLQPPSQPQGGPVPTIDLTTLNFAFRPAFNDDPSLPGRYVPPHPGADSRLLTRDDFEHLPDGRSVPFCSDAQVSRHEVGACYHSNPPTSGPHAAAASSFRVYDRPVPKESLVHAMEHGGVVIWYNTARGPAIALLTELAMAAQAQGSLVVLSPYTEMEAETIALTGWTRLDKFAAADLTPERVQRFIAAHERRFNPEGF